jgi:hypothetical protein
MLISQLELLFFFNWYSGGVKSNWVHSALRPLIGLLCHPGWSWWWRNWWNDWQGKPKYSEKTCPSAALSTTNPTFCLGHRGGKPVTNRLSYGTAFGATLTLRQLIWSAHNNSKFLSSNTVSQIQEQSPRPIGKSTANITALLWLARRHPTAEQGRPQSLAKASLLWLELHRHSWGAPYLSVMALLTGYCTLCLPACLYFLILTAINICYRNLRGCLSTWTDIPQVFILVLFTGFLPHSTEADHCVHSQDLKVFWWWYINTIIVFLDIIHHPVFI